MPLGRCRRSRRWSGWRLCWAFLSLGPGAAGAAGVGGGRHAGAVFRWSGRGWASAPDRGALELSPAVDGVVAGAGRCRVAVWPGWRFGRCWRCRGRCCRGWVSPRLCRGVWCRRSFGSPECVSPALGRCRREPPVCFFAKINESQMRLDNTPE